MKDPMKPRDKITQKMSRDGLTEQNQTTGESELISKRIQDADFQKTPEQQAAQDAAQLQGAVSPSSPLPHAPEHFQNRRTPQPPSASWSISARGQTRKASKKAVRRAQEAAASKAQPSRLQFTDEERANAGAGKVHQEIGQSRRPSGRSAGGTSPKEEIAAAI